MKEITDSFTNLLDQTLNSGVSLLETFAKSTSDLNSKLAPHMKSMKMPNMRGCCEIPPPCWMPKQLTAFTSHVCPGGSASVRFCITNCGLGARTITAEANQGAVVSPASIQLSAMERSCLTVNFTAPATYQNGDCTEILVWLHGCKSYYLRWTVQASNRGCECCHEIEIEDCPDLVHHWYDHFYCVRGCLPERNRVAGT
jgi:hypothetical protein